MMTQGTACAHDWLANYGKLARAMGLYLPGSIAKATQAQAGLLKKSESVRIRARYGRFSRSLVELLKSPRDRHESAQRKPRLKDVFQQPARGDNGRGRQE